MIFKLSHYQAVESSEVIRGPSGYPRMIFQVLQQSRYNGPSYLGSESN